MTRTLHLYLSRELLRVMALALVAFTLVLTMFAIIEPLRKRGLDISQVVSLFTFTLPAMLSFTLPVAALFAATIVYGRFAQDNELLACRASGVSTLTLLKPALGLGVVVTAASLVLANFITPGLAQAGEAAIHANARSVVYHDLISQGYFKFQTYIVHADVVDTANHTLKGVVATNAKDPRDMQVVVASAARLDLVKGKGGERDQLYIDMLSPTLLRTGSQDVAREEGAQPAMESISVPDMMKAKAAFMTWDNLVATLDRPIRHRDVQAKLRDISHVIKHEMMALEMATKLNKHEPYELAAGMDTVYVIRAGHASNTGKQHVMLESAAVGGKTQQVEVTVMRRGQVSQVMTADRGEVIPEYMPKLDNSLLKLKLADPTGVHVMVPGQAEDESLRRQKWEVGQLAIPAAISNAANAVPLDDIYYKSEKLPRVVQAQVEELQRRTIRKVLGEVTAEMNGRLAYSLSCFLLVALGAALGLIYRGGQIISAFAISIVPATIIIILILMGKEHISNTDVQTTRGIWPGLVAIWGGIVALAIVDMAVYIRLVRK